jgi:hypothetical protein
VEADDYDLDDPRAALGPGAVVPDGTPERVHAVSQEPARTSAPRLTMAVDLEGCTASFDAIGFPAIDLDAGVIAVPLAHVLQMSSAPGQLNLMWFDAESGDEIERDEVVSSCTCDPRGDAAVLHWRPETFAAIDAHPCVVDREEEVTCDDQPLPFEDNERAVWRL